MRFSSVRAVITAVILSAPLAFAEYRAPLTSDGESKSVSKIVNATKVLQLTHPWISDENYRDLRLTDTFLERISFHERCPAGSFPCSVLLSFDQLNFPALVQQNKENEASFLIWGERIRHSSSRSSSNIAKFNGVKDCNYIVPIPNRNQCPPSKTTYDVVKTLDCCCYRDPKTGELVVSHTEKRTTYNC